MRNNQKITLKKLSQDNHIFLILIYDFIDLLIKKCYTNYK